MNALNSGYQAQGNFIAKRTTIRIGERCVAACQVEVACRMSRAAGAACSSDTPWLVARPLERWVRSWEACAKAFPVGSFGAGGGNWSAPRATRPGWNRQRRSRCLE